MQNGSAPSNFRPPMRAAPPRAMPAAPARTLLEQQRAHQERQPDAAESKASEWTQHWDEEVGSHYYFNSITGEATWVVQGLS
ncbi:hypothetical protein M885DRAFT_510807 [Pelagophyceae sp. CCMP2097]|nr:hypothetical protein M885DRAFT_510807 [Pelagophyceae sp. CCMP2097]